MLLKFCEGSEVRAVLSTSWTSWGQRAKASTSRSSPRRLSARNTARLTGASAPSGPEMGGPAGRELGALTTSLKKFTPSLTRRPGHGPRVICFGQIANASCNLLWFLFHSKCLLLYMLCPGHYTLFLKCRIRMPPAYVPSLLSPGVCEPLQDHHSPSSVSHSPSPPTRTFERRLSWLSLSSLGTSFIPEDGLLTENVFQRVSVRSQLSPFLLNDFPCTVSPF